MFPEATLISLQVGQPAPQSGPAESEADGTGWVSGIRKHAVTGPVSLSLTQLDGDGQADQIHHGGAHKAVCCYAAEHYPFWRQELDLPDLQAGGFGENFTLEGWLESDVCIGDIWQVGSATVQISQPRQPCWKLARRWGLRDLALRVLRSGYTGWYLRVLEEGSVPPGTIIRRVGRPHPDWTVAAANGVMHHDRVDIASARALSELPALSPSWRQTLWQRCNDRTAAVVTLHCDLHSSLPEWIIDYPETTAVFQEFQLDGHCAGQSLEYVCRQRGLDPNVVRTRLEQVVRARNAENTSPP